MLFRLQNCLKMLKTMTMSEVGEQLHAAREALKLTVQQIADVTKIRTDHIRALEEGQYEVFSAPVYIRGFVRIYAAQLKLNTSQIMSVLDAELKRSEKFKEPPPLMEESNTLLDHADVLAFQTQLAGGSDWRAAVASVVGPSALPVRPGGIMRAANPLAGMKPAMYQSANAGETLPLTKN